jgi:hypothetical protein
VFERLSLGDSLTLGECFASTAHRKENPAQWPGNFQSRLKVQIKSATDLSAMAFSYGAAGKDAAWLSATMAIAAHTTRIKA